jgi:FAD/FMN-containing dehydrogenase
MKTRSSTTTLYAPTTKGRRAASASKPSGVKNTKQKRKASPVFRTTHLELKGKFNNDKIADLVAVFQKAEIPVYGKGQCEFTSSIRHYNRLFRFSQPGLVVKPKTAAHVQQIVKAAKRLNFPLTIKNGAHSYSGGSTTYRGLLVDLADMTKIQLDMDSKVMTIQAGAKWGHATSELSRSGLNGYVLNGGRWVTVGVSGFILEGGIGPFTRSFGMGCDTLKEVTIVTADGSLITVKDTDNPHSPKGKLFWALCGAGGGNFGVVVELKVAVLKLQNKNESVMSSRFVWSPPEDEATFLSTMNRFYTTDFPDQLTIDSSWLLELKRPKPELNMRFLVYYDGDEKGFKKTDYEINYTQRSTGFILPQNYFREVHSVSSRN